MLRSDRIGSSAQAGEVSRRFRRAKTLTGTYGRLRVARSPCASRVGSARLAQIDAVVALVCCDNFFAFIVYDSVDAIDFAATPFESRQRHRGRSKRLASA